MDWLKGLREEKSGASCELPADIAIMNWKERRIRKAIRILGSSFSWPSLM